MGKARDLTRVLGSLATWAVDAAGLTTKLNAMYALINKVGDLAALTTDSKTSLVSALNEVKATGGGGGGGSSVNMCRVAWNVAAGGAISGIRGNASTVIREAAGTWLITFTTPMPDTGYSWAGGLSESETTSDTTVCSTVRMATDTKTTTQFRVRAGYQNSFYDIIGEISVIFVW